VAFSGPLWLTTAGAPLPWACLSPLDPVGDGRWRCKETAVVLPLFLTVLGMCDRNRRPNERSGIEVSPDLDPDGFALLDLATSGSGQFRTDGAGRLLALFGQKTSWRNGVAAMLPAQTDFSRKDHSSGELLAILIASTLVLLCASIRVAFPGLHGSRSACSLVLLGPSMISFQERYIFLPARFPALALAAVLGATAPRARVTMNRSLLDLVVLGCGAVGGMDDAEV